MKDVSGATNSESKSSSKRWACFAAVVVGLLFFLSLSAGSKNQSGDVMVTGQAKQTTHIQEDTGSSVNTDASSNKSKSSSGWGWPLSKNQKDVDKEVEDEVQQAESDFEKTIAEQLALQQPTLSAKMASVMESTRRSLTELLGDSDLVTSEDIEKLGNEIESKLNRDVQKYLKEKTTDLLEAEDSEIEAEADLETEDMKADGETKVEEVVADLEEEKVKILSDLREKIDDLVTDLLKKIKHMAGILAKEMLESLLKEKTGKTYKVSLDENDKLVSFKKYSSSTSTVTGTSTSTSTEKSSSTGTSKTKHTSSSSSGQSSTSSLNHKSSTISESSSTQKSSTSHSSTTKKDAGKPKGKKVRAEASADNDRRGYLR